MAQPNIFGVTEFDQDPETAAELMRLRKQQQIADAMMGQSQQPLQGGMVGQVYVPPSITQGLAKLFQGYSAGRQSADVIDQYRGLASKKAQETADAIAAYKRGTMGTPEQPMGPPTEEGAMGVKPAVIPTPDQRRQAIIEAAVSSNPRLSKMAQLDFQMDARKEDKAAAREDKLFQIELAHQNNIEAIKQRAAEQRISQQQLREQIDAANERNARLVASLRQPTAPTMTEVVDPKDPKRLLRVDAKSYRGGSLGDTGVLGISGKEPTFAAKENKVESGKQQLAETLDQVQASYDALHQLGGLPSQERGTLSNIGSSIASSGIGQIAGRIGSTKEQVERDVIKASRLNVLNALKQATGKSAQELNSNVELKTNLEALSDPTQGYEAATRILDNLRKTYLDGSGSKKPSGSGLSPQEQAELDQLRARFGKK